MAPLIFPIRMPLFLEHKAGSSFLLWGRKSHGAERAEIEGLSRKEGQVL
jgi:hypothetical protein